MRKAIADLVSAITAIDESRLTGDGALELVRICTEAERVLAATRTLATRRVDETKAWQKKGHRTAADWMAATTGTFIGQAVGLLDTAKRLEDLPLTKSEFRAGRLSEAQVREIADAASVAPRQERALIAAAQTQTVKALRQECQKVKATAVSDELSRIESIHRRRYFRHSIEKDGAVRLDVRLTPHDGAEVIAAIEQARSRIFTHARRDGRREPSEAYAADALVELVTRTGESAESGPRALVHVFVDHAVLTSGVANSEQTCEIPGIGSIPAATARALAEDSILKVIVAKGCDVKAVSRATRAIPPRLRTALEARDRVCVVPGCDATRRLEIDHITPHAHGGPTKLDNLARLCRGHHLQKTYLGYRITGRPGAWTWETPNDQEGARPPPDS